MFRTARLSGIVTALSLALNGSLLLAEMPNELTRLTLAKATVERSGTDITFCCKAVLINKTNSVLKVKSTCYSAFDGLELVIFGNEGELLLRQLYVYHQSPFSSDGRWFLLKRGENRKELRFPILAKNIPKDTKRLRVLLLGTLRDSQFQGILCSNMVSVTLP